MLSLQIYNMLCFCIHFGLLSLLGGFPHSSDGKESAHNVGDLGSIPRLGRFQYSGLENSMDCMYSPWGQKETWLSKFHLLIRILCFFNVQSLCIVFSCIPRCFIFFWAILKSLFYFWWCWAFVAAQTLLYLQREGAAFRPCWADFSLPWVLLL